jgi:protein TonB
MTESRPFPIFWIGALALMVAACVVGLVLQLGAFRSELVDRARPTDERPSDERPPAVRAPSAKRTDGLPAYGEYVRVDELPEAIDKVPPEYPEEARLNAVEGTVVVQALIGQDGLVKDTKIMRSVPELDATAVAAVAQWKFKPAKAEGKPVAVWVAVPVRFTLK